jgi:hypothetical protein
MCGDGTYGKSAFHRRGAMTNVMYGKSVIYVCERPSFETHARFRAHAPQDEG